MLKYGSTTRKTTKPYKAASPHEKVKSAPSFKHSNLHIRSVETPDDADGHTYAKIKDLLVDRAVIL